jgi:hypothetical protein
MTIYNCVLGFMMIKVKSLAYKISLAKFLTNKHALAVINDPVNEI